MFFKMPKRKRGELEEENRVLRERTAEIIDGNLPNADSSDSEVEDHETAQNQEQHKDDRSTPASPLETTREVSGRSRESSLESKSSEEEEKEDNPGRKKIFEEKEPFFLVAMPC